MTDKEPVAELDPRFSSADATPTPWAEVLENLKQAEVYWLSTVRPDGRPHVTPLVAVWIQGALYFVTGPSERKAKNLSGNAHVALTTGRNSLGEGLDVIVEGEAVPVRDKDRLQRVADEIAAKYGPPFVFTVRDGDLYGEGGAIYERPRVAFEVAPTTVFGFCKGDSFSQTRWRFA
jgi:nitroimidazol reductase NimA-like FMN-containing flavoprotein (pyridoxamine 5'-phosphate oxidase superfamily)